MLIGNCSYSEFVELMPFGLFRRCSIKVFRLFTAACVGSKPCTYCISTITLLYLSAESRSCALYPTFCLLSAWSLLKFSGSSSSLEQEAKMKKGKKSSGSSFRKLRKLAVFFIKREINFSRCGAASQKPYVPPRSCVSHSQELYRII